MKLFHYFERGTRPLRTLSDLSDAEAAAVQNALKDGENVYARRDYDGRYMALRRTVEENIRRVFIEKGGRPQRRWPIYCILGESHEKNPRDYLDWYRDYDYIELELTAELRPAVSFTYGDSFVANHPEHHDQSAYAERVLGYDEVCAVIAARGWPQDKLTPDSPFWLPRYVEAQLWADTPTA